MKRIILATLTALALTGCSSTNITKLTQALAKDPAIVVVKISSVYGTVAFTRIGSRTNEATTVSADGTVTIKTNP